MKTTVDIADALLEEARTAADREGTTLKALLEAGLLGRAGRSAQAAAPVPAARRQLSRGGPAAGGHGGHLGARSGRHLRGPRGVIAVDTNVLVYAHRVDSPWHPAAARAVAGLAEGRAAWVLPWPCLHEFFAIVTHPRIYKPPTPVAAAVGQIEAWLESPSVVLHQRDGRLLARPEGAARRGARRRAARPRRARCRPVSAPRCRRAVERRPRLRPLSGSRGQEPARHVVPSHRRLAMRRRFSIFAALLCCSAAAPARRGGRRAWRAGSPARRGATARDDRALRAGRDRGGRRPPARGRAARAGEDDRGRADPRRALPAPGLGGQRGAAARAARRPHAARRRHGCTRSCSTRDRGRGSTTTRRSSRACRRSRRAANFYPAGATSEEVEAWLKSLPDGGAHRGRRASSPPSAAGHDGKLVAVPYSVEYQGELARAAELLREAAAATAQPTLKRFLETRAKAFLTNDYYESDVAWMELDATIEPTIGPYETYEDDWFGYKAAFEAFITLRDDAESAQARPALLRAAVARGPAADRARAAQPEARRAGADPRGRRRLLGRRRQPRRADRGLQPAERRARRRREGQQAGDAEEHPAREVRHGAACRSRRSRWRPADQANARLRRLLHPHPDARADARPRPAARSAWPAARPRCGSS